MNSTGIFIIVILIIVILLVIIPELTGLAQISEIAQSQQNNFFQTAKSQFSEGKIFVQMLFPGSTKKKYWFLLDLGVNENICQEHVATKKTMYGRLNNEKSYMIKNLKKFVTRDTYSSTFPFENEEYGGTLGVPFFEAIDIFISYSAESVQYAQPGTGVSSFPKAKIANLQKNTDNLFQVDVDVDDTDAGEWIVSLGENSVFSKSTGTYQKRNVSLASSRDLSKLIFLNSGGKDILGTNYFRKFANVIFSLSSRKLFFVVEENS